MTGRLLRDGAAPPGPKWNFLAELPPSRECIMARMATALEGPRSTEDDSAGPHSLVSFFVAAIAVVALDQLTKHWVVTELGDGDLVRIVDGLLTLRLTYNPGGAFGLGQSIPGFFLVASVLISATILYLARQVEDPRWLIPLGAVLGGGVGNLIDRVVRSPGGEVVDFIDLQVWPLFNVADSAIVVGVATLFFLSFRSPKPER